MPISLILTPFDHLKYCLTLADKCIPDLRVSHIDKKSQQKYNYLTNVNLKDKWPPLFPGTGKVNPSQHNVNK